MSDIMAAALLSGVSALAAVVAYLYKQIIATKDAYTKCAEQHARVDERCTMLLERIEAVEAESRSTSPAKPTTVQRDTALQKRAD